MMVSGPAGNGNKNAAGGRGAGAAPTVFLATCYAETSPPEPQIPGFADLPLLTMTVALFVR